MHQMRLVWTIDEPNSKHFSTLEFPSKKKSTISHKESAIYISVSKVIENTVIID